jgi:hypothetical protein
MGNTKSDLLFDHSKTPGMVEDRREVFVEHDYKATVVLSNCNVISSLYNAP